MAKDNKTKKVPATESVKRQTKTFASVVPPKTEVAQTKSKKKQ